MSKKDEMEKYTGMKEKRLWNYFYPLNGVFLFLIDLPGIMFLTSYMPLRFGLPIQPP
jgi:hypothetical protein